ncbi:Mammalian ependymin-related protein 1 [Acipenser ruthenus]|uniref:Mammalian ependymin-related protein 1 n=1 Tax=Acipenser ruthenus TaxID=7906 RepID=A0A444V1S6_ACIRT|nr:Mammalian ependymin-related protein 1 [Acipenser ruthenus]
MKSLLFPALWLSLCLTALGQKPRPCESPALLEGRIFSAAPSKHVEVLGLFSYDGYLHRFHITEEIITRNQTLFVNYIMLFKESLLYKISFHNKTCERLPLSVPFRPLEVPQDASFGGQLIIGGSSKPGEGLLVNLWKGTDPQTKVDSTIDINPLHARLVEPGQHGRQLLQHDPAAHSNYNLD